MCTNYCSICKRMDVEKFSFTEISLLTCSSKQSILYGWYLSSNIWEMRGRVERADICEVPSGRWALC